MVRFDPQHWVVVLLFFFVCYHLHSSHRFLFTWSTVMLKKMHPKCKVSGVGGTNLLVGASWKSPKPAAQLDSSLGR